MTVEREDPRAARSRAAALAAARDLLLGGGWSAVTHAAVSDRSGIGRNTLYRHWPEPSDLVRDLLVEGMCLEHSTPTGNLRADLVAELEVLRRQLGIPRTRQVMAAVIERAHNVSAFSALPRELHANGAEVLCGILRDAVVGGELRQGLDLEHAVAELLGPMFFLGVVLGEQPRREFVATLVDDFLRAHGGTRAASPDSAPDMPARG